jgi:hypothetical protein
MKPPPVFPWKESPDWGREFRREETASTTKNVREPPSRFLRPLFLAHPFTLVYWEVWRVAVDHLGAQHQRIHIGAQETGDRFHRGAHHRLFLVQRGIEQDRPAGARKEPGDQRMITPILMF